MSMRFMNRKMGKYFPVQLQCNTTQHLNSCAGGKIKNRKQIVKQCISYNNTFAKFEICFCIYIYLYTQSSIAMNGVRTDSGWQFSLEQTGEMGRKKVHSKLQLSLFNLLDFFSPNMPLRFIPVANTQQSRFLRRVNVSMFCKPLLFSQNSASWPYGISFYERSHSDA